MVSNLQVKGYLLVEEIKKRDVTFFIISFTSAMSCHGMLPDTSIIKAISTTIGHSKRWITDEMISTEFAQVLQSWTKFFGTIMQYSYFSVILGSLIKQFILFEIFLQFPLPHAIRVQKILGLGLCELENAQKCKSVPRLLSMIVGLFTGRLSFVISPWLPVRPRVEFEILLIIFKHLSDLIAVMPPSNYDLRRNSNEILLARSTLRTRNTMGDCVSEITAPIF